MKIDFDKKLLKYSIYITITAIIIYMAFLIILNIGSIFKVAFNTLLYLIDLIKPLLIGVLIAYLLYPLTKYIENFLEVNRLYRIQRISLRRALAITFSYILILCIFLGLIFGIYFMIGGQISNNTTLTNMAQHISTYLSNNTFSPTFVKENLDRTNAPFLESIKPYIIDASKYLQKYVEDNLGNMTSYIVSIGSSVATFMIAIVISIYILKDLEYFFSLWHKIYRLIFRSSDIGISVSYVFKTIHESFSKYIKGQLLEAFFVGVLSAISLFIADIDYAIVIGVFAGLSNLIPYVGPIVGTILAAIMGLLSGTPIKIVYAVIAMLIVQQIDSHLLAPKIVGNSVGLHAVFTILAIIIGGNIGGILGMLLAVPIAASCKILLSNWYDNYITQQYDSDNAK